MDVLSLGEGTAKVHRTLKAHISLFSSDMRSKSLYAHLESYTTKGKSLRGHPGLSGRTIDFDTC